MRTCRASRSASENTATEAMPCSRQGRITRTAISPRLATRTFGLLTTNLARLARITRTATSPRLATRAFAILIKNLARVKLEAREEVRDLGRRRLRRVGAVHCVGLARGGELLSDAAPAGPCA